MHEMRRNQKLFVRELKMHFKDWPLEWYYSLKSDDLQLCVNVAVLLIIFASIAFLVSQTLKCFCKIKNIRGT